jgi:chemotaxis signal transduction protein
MNKTSLIPIDSFIPFMQDVVRCEQSLHELNFMWRVIESSAKMNCPVEARAILPTMAATREGFNRLETELVLSLVQEKISTVLEEIGTKAHYVIDILIRNLYERTADVGFLATDKELCAFVAGLSGDAESIRYRLRAYRSKYTVYDEIILLDLDGNVLVQINNETPIEGSVDSLILKTLASDGYIETFRASDLRPSKSKALIYSKRMLHPDTGVVIGVLCLCFNFSEEVTGIFDSHGDPTKRSVMLLLDDNNQVIESSDHLWISIGAIVPSSKNGDGALKMYAGRQYLVRTYYAEGYQGYDGPDGWQGQVMIPLDVAFVGGNSDVLKALEPNMVDGLLSHAKTFCPPLFEIMTTARTINRVVWNGQVMTAGQGDESQRLKSILNQISETGVRSNELFAQSINDLYETVLSSKLQDSEFVSHLLIDLLDRNLYERSDDCRWWAVTPVLRAALISNDLNDKTIKSISNILEYINKLYTVYTRIFVYDQTGTIVVSTHDYDNSVIGSKINRATLENVMSLSTEQHYYVSPFVRDALYDNASTYIYHAAIRAPNSDRIVGGIGVVFDSSPEFLAMLQSGIQGQHDVKAFYINRQGEVISSTDGSRPVGAVLDLDKELLDLPNGKSASRIVIHDGQYAVLGCSVSNGYREFKVTDGYKEDLIAVVYYFLGAVNTLSNAGRDIDSIITPPILKSKGVEFATFTINGSLFAIEAEYIVQASSSTEISSVTIGSRSEHVGVLAIQNENDEKEYVWVFDLNYLLNSVPSVKDSSSQVIVINYDSHRIGLLVSTLHSVAEFDLSQISSSAMLADNNGVLIKSIIQANQGDLLIQWLDIAYLIKMLSKPFDTVIL